MFEDMGERNRQALATSDVVFRKWVKIALRKKTIVGWIVEVKGRVAGSGCVWLQPALPSPQRETRLVRPYLFSMFTEPEFRRAGVASRIVSEAIMWCKDNGYQSMLLHASKKARGLYRKHGFTRTWEMKRPLKIGQR
jgi:GNAT superfamily N-acetyltransferase